MDTARHSQLQQEAELRAEHQAMARVTMLNLARALDEAHANQRELGRLLQEEREASAALRSKCDRLEDELDRALAAEEQRQADRILQKGFESGNKVFLSMMIEKSREVYQADLFGDDRPDGWAAIAGSMHTGDRITFSWIFKLWMREVNATKDRLAQEAAERARKEEEEARKRMIQEEIEKRVGEMHKLVESLGSQLDAANETIEQNRRKMRNMEKQLEAAAAQAAEREQQHEAAMAELRAEQQRTQQALADTEAQLQRTRQELEQAQAAFRRAEAEHEAERQQLQETIRKISSELHEAVVLARYMREAMLKAKRDAAASVSPAKFAQLISQLEEMRDQLNALHIDCKGTKAANAELQQKLDKNRRRLELERQFLPLIRQARGPLGPKGGGQDISMLPGHLPDPQVPEGPKKLQRSQSVVSHTGHRGHPLMATT